MTGMIRRLSRATAVAGSLVPYPDVAAATSGVDAAVVSLNGEWAFRCYPNPAAVPGAFGRWTRAMATSVQVSAGPQGAFLGRLRRRPLVFGTRLHRPALCRRTFDEADDAAGRT